MRFYVSGPMRQVPEFNFPMFDKARNHLHLNGHAAISPADHDREIDPNIESSPGYATGDPSLTDMDYDALLGWDLATIALDVDAILLLPGWETSVGAGHELAVARALSKEVWYFHHDASMYWMTREQEPVLIGLSGYAQAGKDTVGAVLCENADFERLAFADALKAVLTEVDPLINWWDGGGDEPISIPLSWRLVEEGWESTKANNPMSMFNARTYLQRLGNAVRDYVDPNAWLNAVMRQVKPGGKYVITDVRFPNEAQAIKDVGGQVWRIERPGTGPANAHVSETALDDWPFDLLIRNQWDLPYLHEVVIETMNLATA